MMGYRGEDLDLRTPQTWTANAGDLIEGGAATNGIRRGRGYAGQRGDPIVVDDTVMAAVNHAFDVAVTHRASEVRLEHLVYALTRIDAASEILEARGLRVPALRREAGTIVASDIPVAAIGIKSPPRRSDDLEDVLRHAADAALRRNAAATVDDVLNALSDLKRDQGAVALLRRHWARGDIEPAARPVYAPEPRYGDTGEARERVRISAGSQYVNEPARSGRLEPAGTITDTFQNVRIEKLEQALRALSADLAGERKSTLSLLTELQREISAQRDDSLRFRSGLQDRISGMEQVVVSSRDTGVPALLHDRLLQIESGLATRLGEVTRGWSLLSDRLQSLEQSLLLVRGDGQTDVGPLQERIGALERAVHGGMTDGARNWAALTDRLRALEQAVTGRQAVRVDTSGIEARLDAMERAISARTVRVDTAAIEARLDGLENAVLSIMPSQTDMTPIADRLARIEQAVAGGSGGAVDLGPLAERLRQVEEGQAAQRVQAMQLNAGVTTEIKQLAQMLSQALAQQSGGGNGEQLKAMLNDRFQALAGYLERQRGETVASLTTSLNERVALVDTAIGAVSRKVADDVAGQSQTIAALQDTMSRLASYQQALSGTLEQWRLDGTSDLGIISNRLEAIEAASLRPIQMVEELTQKVEATQRIVTEKVEHRGFRYWLFGTHDWVGASWSDRPMRVPVAQAGPGGRAQPPQSFRK